MPAAQMSRAVILAVGSELLTPSRIDTNSLFVTQRLNELGVRVRYKAVVGDHHDDLAEALRLAMPRADLVVISGGLGPTDDDITRETVAAVFGLPLDEDQDVVASIRARFAARGLPMPAINLRQALVPRGAVALANAKGTAPGLWIERSGVACVALPGPARELHAMFDAVARDRVAPRSGGHGISRRVIRVTGRTESHVEEIAYPVYSRWRSVPVPIETSILASLGQIELHLAARGATEDAARALDDATTELAGVLGRDLVSSDGSQLEAVVGRMLRERGCRVAVAESCTGGLVASRLTDVAGSSAYAARPALGREGQSGGAFTVEPEQPIEHVIDMVLYLVAAFAVVVAPGRRPVPPRSRSVPSPSSWTPAVRPPAREQATEAAA